MTLKRKIRIVTSHSDENPELGGEGGGPIAAHSIEGSAVSELYKKDNEQNQYFHYKPRAGQTVLEETTYIPDEN